MGLLIAKTKSMDVVRLSWDTTDRDSASGLSDLRVCSNYRGITLLSLSGKVYARVLEWRIWPMVVPWTEWFLSWQWNTGPGLYSLQDA